MKPGTVFRATLMAMALPLAWGLPSSPSHAILTTTVAGGAFAGFQTFAEDLAIPGNTNQSLSATVPTSTFGGIVPPSSLTGSASATATFSGGSTVDSLRVDAPATATSVLVPILFDLGVPLPGASAGPRIDWQWSFSATPNTPIVFTVNGILATSASASGVSATGTASATVRIEGFDQLGVPVDIFRQGSSSQVAGGPLVTSGNGAYTDVIVTLEDTIFTGTVIANVQAGASQFGGTATASATSDPFVLVDFAATEILIRGMFPLLTDPEVAAALAAIDIEVSPGIDLAAFASQFSSGPGGPPIASIPEPGTLLLFGFGLAGLGFLRRRHKATS